VGTSSALHGGEPLQVGPFLAALVAALLIQVGTNFANDVFDFRHGADTPDRLGPLRVTQSGLVSPQDVLRATFITFGLALLVGIYLVAVGGWPILLIGLLSIVAGLAYTGGPLPYGYYGLGDVLCFVFFGLLGVLGSAYLQTLQFTLLNVWAAIPVGCLVTAILVVNNLRDIDTDRQVGKHTLAVKLGRRGTRMEYTALVILAYLVPLGLGLIGVLAAPWFLMPFLSVPLARSLIQVVSRTEGRPLNQALKGTGQLHLVFGLLFAASLWLA
ncbi:MAG TPA: 1,4-dihydroxy-2-naphthoate polyprenyltransferase, partial [Chloroflexota bacterium]|nr:1,4-dihydroxy-2-naphthoate polyprenyltransferase [Chloroflexota bacterium]